MKKMSKFDYELVLELRKSGKTLQEIGDLLHLTKQNISYWLIKGFPPEESCIYKNNRIYNIFNCLKQRCNNPKNHTYKYYGGRGIKCEWNSFKEFYKDMFPSYKEGLSIDRINVNENYCKNNCRWIPLNEQQKNRRPFKEWELISTFWKVK